MASCGVQVRPKEVPALQRQLLEDRGWFRGLTAGDGSKGVYVQLLDGSLLSSGDAAGGEGAPAGQAVLSARERTVDGAGALASWERPWLVRARSEPELTAKVAYLGCLLQTPYWAVGGHAAAISFGTRREQRVGPYPGYCEQWFRYDAQARGLELWHANPLAVQPEPVGLGSGLVNNSVAPDPLSVDGPAIPERRAFDNLADGSVVLACGLWSPFAVPASLLWWTIPRSLPHAWPRQLGQLYSLLNTLRDGLCHTGEGGEGAIPKPMALWLRTAFSVLLDRIDLSETLEELGNIAEAVQTLIHLVQCVTIPPLVPPLAAFLLTPAVVDRVARAHGGKGKKEKPPWEGKREEAMPGFWKNTTR